MKVKLKLKKQGAKGRSYTHNSSLKLNTMTPQILYRILGSCFVCALVILYGKIFGTFGTKEKLVCMVYGVRYWTGNKKAQDATCSKFQNLIYMNPNFLTKQAQEKDDLETLDSRL